MVAYRPKSQRDLTRLRDHYEIEKALAGQLRAADRGERSRLYKSVYNELFQRVPDHPQLTRLANANARARDLNRQMTLLRRFTSPGMTYLELGAGDCSVALEMAKAAARVYAVEVSDEITRGLDAPTNFTLLITDGSDIPVAPGQVDLVYSNQLMEHLHPEDSEAVLQNVIRAMKPGAAYVCVTPNAISGPHDISGRFDGSPSGFHLKEYAVGEMVELFRAAGFSRFRLVIGARGIFLPFQVPVWPVRFLESALRLLPSRTRRVVARTYLMRLLLGMNFVAFK